MPVKLNQVLLGLIKKLQKLVKIDKSPVNESSDYIKTTILSNDELLFKYADLYEKGLLTKYEFDRKKKELLFNDD